MSEIVLKRKLAEATQALVKAREFDHSHIAAVAMALEGLVNARTDEKVFVVFAPYPEGD